MLTALREWSQKRRLRAMLKDPRSTRGFRSTEQLEKRHRRRSVHDRATSAEHRREKGRRRGRMDAQSALSADPPSRLLAQMALRCVSF